MRSKEEILKQVCDFTHPDLVSTASPKVFIASILEVLIDIRDIFDERLQDLINKREG